MSKNIPLHRIFKLRVEGIISETKMLESESKKLVIKSLPSNLTNIEIITNKVLPYGKIQIATSGINVNQLKGSINNIPLSFEVDPIVGSSQVLYTMAPYLTAGIYKLSIANFNLSLEIGQMPAVSNSSEYVNNISNNSVNLGSVITESGRFNNLLSSDGMALFSKYNEVVNAFDNYIKNEATPAEIQEIANIINANALSDSNAYFFVKNDRESIRNFFSNLNNKKIVSKIISIFIEDSYAQEAPQNSLKKLLMSKITEAVKFSLTLGFNTIIDGMVNKCYISKGRSVPSYIVSSETILTFSFGASVTAVLANQIGGAYGYYSTISAAQALVIVIGNDCEGDSTIIPKLVIKSQPIAPIIPGESIDFGVKCDVGDSRYYTPGSILTRVTSKFDYISEELKETGDLIARDKLVHSCSGLGQDAIKDSHNIHCTTNLLEETSYYQNNSSQYETINPAQCNNGNEYYDVGTYLASSPDFSCNFVNPENNVNIIGKKVIVNQLVFDLSKQMKCPPKPKAIINFTKNNLVVNFDSTDPQDPNASGLTYSWDFGDGQTANTTSKTLSHTYAQAGTYNVSLTVTDEYGGIAETNASVQVQDEVSFWFGVYGRMVNFSYVDPTGYYLPGKTFYWDFGDGTSGTGSNAQRIYTNTGKYIVKLKVLNTDGSIENYSKEVLVNAARVSVCGALSDGSIVTVIIEGIAPFTVANNTCQILTFNDTTRAYQVDMTATDRVIQTSNGVQVIPVSPYSGQIIFDTYGGVFLLNPWLSGAAASIVIQKF